MILFCSDSSRFNPEIKKTTLDFEYIVHRLVTCYCFSFNFKIISGVFLFEIEKTCSRSSSAIWGKVHIKIEMAIQARITHY